MTDRELMVAVLQAVCGLAERLTGESMTLRIDTEAGEITFSPNDRIVWQRPAPPRSEVAAIRPANQTEHCSMQS
jgi:hypothetical protein